MMNKLIIVVTIACLCVFWFHLALPADPQMDRLEGIFNWAKKYYFQHRYRTASKTLQTLLTYLDKKSTIRAHRKLMGKSWLLLGVINETMGNQEAAKEYYAQAKEVAEQIKADHPGTWIEEINFKKLPTYQLSTIITTTARKN